MCTCGSRVQNRFKSLQTQYCLNVHLKGHTLSCLALKVSAQLSFFVSNMFDKVVLTFFHPYYILTTARDRVLVVDYVAHQNE